MTYLLHELATIDRKTPAALISLISLICVSFLCSCTVATGSSELCYPGPGISVAVVFTVAAEVTRFILHWCDSVFI